MRTSLTLAFLIGLVSVAWGREAVDSTRTGAPEGGRLYRARCAPCHGESGKGDGPDAAIFLPAPRNLHDGLLDRYDVEAIVRMVRDGAALPLALDLPALKARAGEVETLVAHIERLPEIDWQLAERGEEIYVDRCEICHGPTGRAGPMQPPGVRQPRDLSDPAFQHLVGDRELLTVVRHGRHGMPAIPALRSDEDAKALAAFVRVLSPGFTLYGRYCGSCHGESGRAEDMVDPAHMPRVVFDRSYFKGRDPEELRTKVWHMLSEQRPAMPHFRESLSERQARAIVVYLKTKK
jgi:mono/diheme cytochrome c family protein